MPRLRGVGTSAEPPLWECPVCERAFANRNQSHTCAALGDIDAPTLITFGARDLVCSTRFAEPMTSGIAGSELVVFDHLSHAGLHQDPETFNRATLDFLLRRRS